MRRIPYIITSAVVDPQISLLRSLVLSQTCWGRRTSSMSEANLDKIKFQTANCFNCHLNQSWRLSIWHRMQHSLPSRSQQICRRFLSTTRAHMTSWSLPHNSWQLSRLECIKMCSQYRLFNFNSCGRVIYAPNHKLWQGMIIRMDSVLKPSHLTKATMTVRQTRLTAVKAPRTKVYWSNKIQFRRMWTSLIWPNKVNRLNLVSSRPKRVHRTRCLIIFRLCAKLRNSSEKI